MTTGRINQVSNAVRTQTSPAHEGQASPETVHFAAPEGTRVVETENREVELASRW